MGVQIKAAYVGPLVAVPKVAVDVERIKKELLIENGSYFKALAMTGEAPANQPKHFKCWEETSEYIKVPRHYKIPWVKELKPLRLSYHKPVSRTVSPKFSPRPHQPPAIAALAKPGDKIIAVRCGGGKTIITLAAWAKHRTGPLLILVDTEELANQWINAAKAVVGLRPEEIGRLQGDTEDWKGRSIVVGLVQTMWRRQYEPALYKYFHVVAYDEVHVCGSSKFQLVLPKFYGERWGLSATPERADGNTKLIKLHMGEIVYEDLQQPLEPKVYFIQLKYKAPGWMLQRRYPHLKAMVCSVLAKKAERNREVLARVDQAARSGRSILVLGDRVLQHQWFVERSEFREESGLLVAGEYRGKTKVDADGKKVQVATALTKDERKAALTKRVVYATSKLASKGLDKPELDTLVLPFPYSDANLIQQMFGRIQREVESGKRQPLVLVFEDDVATLIKGCDSIREYCDKHRIKYKIIGRKNEKPEKGGKQAIVRFKKGMFRRRYGKRN